MLLFGSVHWRMVQHVSHIYGMVPWCCLLMCVCFLILFSLCLTWWWLKSNNQKVGENSSPHIAQHTRIHRTNFIHTYSFLNGDRFCELKQQTLIKQTISEQSLDWVTFSKHSCLQQTNKSDFFTSSAYLSHMLLSMFINFPKHVDDAKMTEICPQKKVPHIHIC